MWFIIYRNYHVVPWQDWSSAGVDPDFPTKALLFFFLLHFAGSFTPGCWGLTFFPWQSLRQYLHLTVSSNGIVVKNK